MNETNYKQEIQERVEKEFDAFKADMLTKTVEEVFFSNYEIHVKTELKETLFYDEYFSDRIYRLLYKVGDDLLDFLYNEFISDEFVSVNTYDDTARFIQDTMEYRDSLGKEGDGDETV
ncbi:MAG: DUF3848 domain-containing protein [Clostridia bacterium]|nr:DUF3848 domain-containing protein [Clostridia bacterium]